jgi:hypothetical protein
MIETKQLRLMSAHPRVAPPFTAAYNRPNEYWGSCGAFSKHPSSWTVVAACGSTFQYAVTTSACRCGPT